MLPAISNGDTFLSIGGQTLDEKELHLRHFLHRPITMVPKEDDYVNSRERHVKGQMLVTFSFQMFYLIHKYHAIPLNIGLY